MERDNDVTMNIKKAMDFAQVFVISPGILLSVQIYQFIARMYKEKQMRKTDWENFDKFAKFTGYQYDVATIPLQEKDLAVTEEPMLDKNGKPVLDDAGAPKMKQISMRESKKAEIKERLDAMGIHYCVMDNDFSDKNIKIYFSKNDKHLMESFFADYVKENLTSGEMPAQDLKNLLNERVSIISVPDELEQPLREAMSATGVSYAAINGLHLTDGQKQLYISNMSTGTVSQLYSSLRTNLVTKGMDPGPMAVIPTEQLLTAATPQSMDDYLSGCSSELKEISESYITADSKNLEEVMARYQPLGSKDSIEFIRDSSYQEISIDAETLIDADKNREFAIPGLSEENFYCQIPGTYGKDVKFASIPKDQVFLDKNAAGTRYTAFIRNDRECVVLNIAGEPKRWEASEVLKHFDRSDCMSASLSTLNLSMHM